MGEFTKNHILEIFVKMKHIILAIMVFGLVVGLQRSYAQTPPREDAETPTVKCILPENGGSWVYLTKDECLESGGDVLY